MKPLVLPQVNLNGTSRERLVEQQSDVATALRKTYQAMAEAAPNGRDYQFRPAEFYGAQEAWQERMQAIYLMLKEIMAHATAIQDAE